MYPRLMESLRLEMKALMDPLGQILSVFENVKYGRHRICDVLLPAFSGCLASPCVVWTCCIWFWTHHWWLKGNWEDGENTLTLCLSQAHRAESVPKVSTDSDTVVCLFLLRSMVLFIHFILLVALALLWFLGVFVSVFHRGGWGRQKTASRSINTLPFHSKVHFVNWFQRSCHIWCSKTFKFGKTPQIFNDPRA